MVTRLHLNQAQLQQANQYFAHDAIAKKFFMDGLLDGLMALQTCFALPVNVKGCPAYKMGVEFVLRQFDI